MRVCFAQVERPVRDRTVCRGPVKPRCADPAPARRLVWQPSGMSEPPVKTVSLELTEDERRMLVYGLRDWGGPAHGTDSLAVAVGFASLDHLQEDGGRIADAIAAGRALPVRDWTRAMVATEIVFVSDVLGTGSEWTVINGGTDAYWIDVLRSLQRKVPQGRRFLGR
jgi:hypothetical protein